MNSFILWISLYKLRATTTIPTSSSTSTSTSITSTTYHRHHHHHPPPPLLPPPQPPPLPRLLLPLLLIKIILIIIIKIKRNRRAPLKGRPMDHDRPRLAERLHPRRQIHHVPLLKKERRKERSADSEGSAAPRRTRSPSIKKGSMGWTRTRYRGKRGGHTGPPMPVNRRTHA